MHVPDCAVGLWNAAWYFVFIGAAATFVWQSEQACCGAVAGFSAFDAWWHVVQVLPARWVWSSCSSRTPPIGEPVRTTTSLATAFFGSGGAGFCGAAGGGGAGFTGSVLVG